MHYEVLDGSANNGGNTVLGKLGLHVKIDNGYIYFISF